MKPALAELPTAQNANKPQRGNRDHEDANGTSCWHVLHDVSFLLLLDHHPTPP